MGPSDSGLYFILEMGQMGIVKDVIGHERDIYFNSFVHTLLFSLLSFASLQLLFRPISGIATGYTWVLF